MCSTIKVKHVFNLGKGSATWSSIGFETGFNILQNKLQCSSLQTFFSESIWKGCVQLKFFMPPIWETAQPARNSRLEFNSKSKQGSIS